VADVPADAIAALDGPDPVRPLPHVLQHHAVAGAVGGKPATTSLTSSAAITSMGDRPLVRVHPDHYSAHPSTPMLDAVLVVEPGGQRYFEPNNPLEPLPALGDPRPAQAK
jgi:hypothetical protein